MVQQVYRPRCIAALIVLVAFVFTLIIRPAAAQTTGAGAITGTITDANQAVVPNAAVTLTNTDTGVVHNYTSNDAGIYRAPFLQPGHYNVSATASGFSRSQASNITLLVGQTLTINLALGVQATTTTVEVSGSNQILDVEKTEVSQVVDTHLVANLPVNARNWSDFVLLTPNVTQDGSSGLVSFHGISGLYNQNYVDGANNNQMLFSEARGRSNGAPYVYSADAIKEFQAETSNYSVEFGQAAGGQVNAITKSGTNNLHGDLFYFLRYPDLNALDPLTKYNALYNQPNPVIKSFLLTQPTHQQQQFGGSAGGPIKKDRLFYFFTYDGFRKVGKALYTDSNYISTTPSDTTPPPSGTSPSNTITPTQCPTTITAAQCTAGIQFLINESTAAPSRVSKEDLFFPRLDFHINSKNDVFADFNFVNFQSGYGYSGAATFSNSSPSTNGPTYYHERFLVGGWTSQIGSASVNDFHGQYGRDLETAGAYSAGPSVSMGAVTFGMPNALPRAAEPDEHRIQLSDVFSTVHGRHTFKFGGDANIVHEVMINLYQGGGLYGYGDSTNVLNFQDWIQDAFAGQAGDTDPYAGYHYNSFVETVDQVNKAPGTQGKDDFWMKMYDGFAEDTWKLTSKVTVTAGVRYDVQLTPDPGLVNHLFDPISSEYTSKIKNVLDRVQPRIGFSWAPFQGSVVRGGYGMFSALNQGSTYYAMRVENGVVQLNYSYSGCKSSVGTSGSTCPTPPAAGSLLQYPNLPYTPAGPPLSQSQYPSGGTVPTVSLPVSSRISYSFHGLDPNFVPPLAHEWNLSMEQALPAKISFQIGYLGTRGMRLPVFVDANLVGQKPSGMASYAVQDASNNVTRVMTVPVYLPSDRRNTALSSFNTGYSVANTWYNAMAMTVRRPFANGLEVLGNFTWAKATDTGQVQGANGTFYGGDVPSDPNNIKLDNGPSDIDIRNRGTFSFVYQPEFVQGNKWMKNAVDGFVFSGAEVASGGEPIYMGVGGTIYSGNTNAKSYADEGGIYGGAIASSYGGATNGRPPQIGRNSIYMPGFNDFDMRISRKIPIHERFYMQVAAEAFNLLNHEIITGVNGTYTTFLTPGASAKVSSSLSYTCNAVAPPTGGIDAGCFVPYQGTGLSAFGAASSTSSSTLYGSRQLQISAKLFF
ncbi:MAG TPA: carboxypeptidase regulatory-like domain-containing protein [Terracidiphilus sp.]|nr:carboxypeptidase regulatory-like domain-containing protein [Terracidiphilus sp.]